LLAYISNVVAKHSNGNAAYLVRWDIQELIFACSDRLQQLLFGLENLVFITIITINCFPAHMLLRTTDTHMNALRPGETHCVKSSFDRS
jgi:hypothetical protein